jgi:hypothetical protein
MHIHGNNMAVNQANLYSAAQAERTASAERAAEVRKKLLKSAAGLDGTTPEEALMIGQWLNPQHSSTLTGDEYHVAGGKDSNLG